MRLSIHKRSELLPKIIILNFFRVINFFAQKFHTLMSIIFFKNMNALGNVVQIKFFRSLIFLLLLGQINDIFKNYSHTQQKKSLSTWCSSSFILRWFTTRGGLFSQKRRLTRATVWNKLSIKTKNLSHIFRWNDFTKRLIFI